MACAEHDWFFSTPCPKCAATVTVTAPPAPLEKEADRTPPDIVTEPEGQPAMDGVAENGSETQVPPDLPTTGPQVPEIPGFLRRKPDGSFVEPAPWGELKPLAVSGPPALVDFSTWSDADLWAAASAHMSVGDRQPIIREMTRRENRRKTYARLDSAGFTKAKDGNTDPTTE